MTTPVNPNPPITTPIDSQNPAAFDPHVAKTISKGAASQTNAVQRPVDKHLSTSAEPWLEPPNAGPQASTAAAAQQALEQIEQCGVDFAAIEDLLIKNNLTAFKESENASDSLMDQQIQALKSAANKMESQAKTQEAEAIVSAVVGLALTLTTTLVGFGAAYAGLAQGAAEGIDVMAEDSSELTSELSDPQTQESDSTGDVGDESSNTLFEEENTTEQTEINQEVTEERVQESQESNQQSSKETVEEEEEKLQEGKEKLQQQDQDKEALKKQGFQDKFRWQRFAAIAGIGEGISTAVQHATNAGFQSAISNEQQAQMQDQQRSTLDGDLYSKAVNYANESLQGVQQALSEIQSAVADQDAAIRKIFS